MWNKHKTVLSEYLGIAIAVTFFTFIHGDSESQYRRIGIPVWYPTAHFLAKLSIQSHIIFVIKRLVNRADKDAQLHVFWVTGHLYVVIF
jgi:hypothetical protein